MSTWGLKYQTEFTSQSDDNNAEIDYTLQFLFKDYSGVVNSIIGGSTTVLQKCTVDDPFAPIKGQSLEIKLVNTGNLPITSFYSEDDDGVKVILTKTGGQTLFTGFLVQDDGHELMVDYQHELSLSANDSLGLLKGVILSDADTQRSYEVNVVTNGNLNELLVSAIQPFYILIDDVIEVLGVTYTVTAISYTPITIGGRVYNYTLTVTPAIAAAISQQDITMLVTGPLNLYDRNTLSSVIYSCLKSTNLDLITNIYCNILELNHVTTKSFFDQTMIDTQLFIKSDSFDDCYSVLETILYTFRCSLFQANNQWNIIRWSDMQLYANNQVPGFQYDENFVLLGTNTFNNNFYIGPSPQLTRPLAGLMDGVFRPYKFSKKTFNYTQPKYVLKNYDLQTLGPLIRQYQYASLIIKEYVAVGWLAGLGPNTIERFIRVVTDATGTEIERYLCIKGIPFDDSRSVQGTPFEGRAGDKLTYSFSVRSTNVPATVAQFALMALNGVSPNKYVQNYPVDNGAWLNTIGFAFTTTGTNNTWNSVSIKSSGIPFNGLIYCYLANINQTPGANNETHYKDIRLQYEAYINDTTKITGHIHNDQQPNNIKNNIDKTILIDDSPRGNIQGALFLPTTTALLQNLTSIWKYTDSPTYYKLGELMTKEDIKWRSVLRSKLDGEFVGIIQDNYCSLLTAVITDFKPTKVYTFGLLSIDYKRNRFSGTLWEISDTENPEVIEDYTFKYIYSTT